MHTFQYRKRYEITCDLRSSSVFIIEDDGFNTASGMRSHVTQQIAPQMQQAQAFQYRKRYEITCDRNVYRVSCDQDVRFNTASGMRSHVTGNLQ